MYKGRIGENKTESDRLEGLVENNTIDSIKVTDLTVSTLSTASVSTGTVTATGAIAGASVDASGDVSGGTITTDSDVVVTGKTGEGIKMTSDFGFHDIMGQIDTRGVGATDPAWTQIGSSPFSAYAFAVDDVAWINYHVPHDYVPGTDIYIHTHWIPSGTDTNPVKWEWTYMYADGHNQANFNVTGTSVTAEESPPGTAYRHMVTESSAITISGMEVDGIISVRLKRLTNGATENTDTIFVLTADIHYQSSGLPTPNRAPNFYNT